MDDKKRNIAVSAMEVFQNKGIEKATVSEIVKRAGIAQGTFYLYFPSKLSVMPAIAELMVGKTVEAYNEKIDADMPFTVQLERFIDLIFEFTKKYRDIYALIYVGMGSNQQLNEWEAIYEPFYQLVSDFLKKAQDNKEIRQHVEPDRTAILLIGLLESAAEQIYLYDDEREQAITQKKEDVMDFALHALRPS